MLTLTIDICDINHDILSQINDECLLGKGFNQIIQVMRLSISPTQYQIALV